MSEAKPDEVIFSQPELAKIHHDIRTPLGALIGLSTILAKTAPLTPKQEQIIATLQTSAEDLNKILEEFFSKNRRP